jgi:septal ring factor EnvC (AmiA/AmiB activator)
LSVFDDIVGQFGSNISDFAHTTNKSLASLAQQQPATNTPTLYSWTGPKEFNEKISQIETKLSEKEEEMQKDLQDKLANLLKSSTNIGFNPTIRNVIAVIMASAEGFLRLMNEVHENAFKESV